MTVAAPAGPPGVRPPAGSVRRPALVAGWTLVSRLTGLLRVVVIGAVLGATYVANAVQAGSFVPNLVYTVIAGPVLAMVLVPALVRALAAGGPDRARHVLARVALAVLAAAGSLTLLLVLLSPAVAAVLTAGVPAGPDRERAQELTTMLVVLVAPQVLLYSVAALGVAAQQARGRFGLAAAAPATENLGLIATVVVSGWVFGRGLEIDEVGTPMIVLLGAGSTAAVALHAGLQVVGWSRVGLLTVPRRGWRDEPEARTAVRRLARSVVVSACPAAALFALLAVAGSVPGGVVVVQLSASAYFALSYLGGRAVSTAALPDLADLAGTPQFAPVWRRTLRYVVTAGLPLLCLLVVFAGPAADLLANGELRRSALLDVLAGCLAVVAVAQLLGGVHDAGRQALFARSDDAGPRWAAAVALAATLVGALAALALPPGGGRLVALVGALAAGEAAGAAFVLVRLRAAVRPEPVLAPRGLWPPLVAALPLLTVAGGVALLGAAVDPGRLGAGALATTGGLLGLAAYVLVLRRVEAGRTSSPRPTGALP